MQFLFPLLTQVGYYEIHTIISEVRNMASYLYANYGCGCVFGDRLFGCHGKYCCSHCWYKNRVVYDARLVMGKEKVMEDNSRTIDELVAREGFTLMVRDELDRAYAKHGNVQTLPMSDRKRQLVKKWVTTGKEKRRGW